MGLENASDTSDIGGDLTVHRFSFGAMYVTGDDIIGEPDDVENAKRVLHKSLTHGVDLIDTADSYGLIVSECLIDEVLAPYPDDLVVTTKGGLLRNTDGDWKPNGDPDYLRNAVLGSLDRLRVDTIDLYQLHRPGPYIPFEDLVRTLAEMKDEGLIRHVDLSNVSVEQFDGARDIVGIATVQNRFNIGDREFEASLDACEEYGIGFIPWYPLDADDLGDRADAIAAIAEKHNATPQQIALAWLLRRSDVMLSIPGMSSASHLRDNVVASHIDLDDEDMD